MKLKTLSDHYWFSALIILAFAVLTMSLILMVKSKSTGEGEVSGAGRFKMMDDNNWIHKKVHIQLKM